MVEWQWRLLIFGVALGLLMLLEHTFPRRPRVTPKYSRGIINLGLSFLDSLALRFLLPVSTIAWALTVETNDWSLFHLTRLPPLISFVLSFILLDCLIYWQHRIFHRVPLLWRLHKIHHTDLDLDVTSGVRFHPLEALISALTRMAFVWIAGIPAFALLIFEIVLNVSSLFNHSNIGISAAWDARVRKLLVTPDMHRVHHSIVRQETDSNFGFCLAWWDRLFGSYMSAPRAGQMDMTIGLPDYRSPLAFGRLLNLPFKS